MSKKPDLSDMAKKINLNGWINNIKALVSSEGQVPDVDPDDALGVKLESLTKKVNAMTKAQLLLANDLKEVSQLLNGVYTDIEALRAEHRKPKEEGKSQSPKSTKSEKSAAAVESSQEDSSDGSDQSDDAAGEDRKAD